MLLVIVSTQMTYALGRFLQAVSRLLKEKGEHRIEKTVGADTTIHQATVLLTVSKREPFQLECEIGTKTPTL